MLKSFLKNDQGIVSHLGETMPNKIHMFNDTDLFIYKYNKYFNEYSFELTISPKSSPLLTERACAHCVRTKIKSLSDQEELIIKLISEITNEFKINILGTIELYKDNIHLHTHSIINNMKKSKLNKLKKKIYQYYSLDNKYIVNIKQIINIDKYREYLIKDTYQYYCYNELDNHDIDQEIYQQELDKINNQKLKVLHDIYSDPIKLHLHDCIFSDCPICNWIKQSENVNE